jgi:predicted dehydrogenase
MNGVVDRMDPMRLAVIGAGAIAQRNAREAAQSGVVKIAGVFDVNAKVARQMADALGTRTFATYEQVLESREVDAVLVSTPHHLHKSMAVQAAEAGKHVLVEKPLANTIAEADEIVAACRKAGVALTVNYSFRYLAKIRKARELVEAGALGDIAGIQVVSHQFKDAGYWMGARSNSPGDWRSSREKAGGGFLIMTVCHTIDYLYYITGLRGTKVYSEYATVTSPGDVEDIVSVTSRWGDSAVGSISASSIMRGSDVGEERIWGTKGTLILDGAGLSLYSTRLVDGKKPGRVHTYHKFPTVNWTAEWVREFAAAVQAGREPEVSYRAGWENVAFIDTAYRSLLEGKALDVPEFAS